MPDKVAGRSHNHFRLFFTWMPHLTWPKRVSESPPLFVATRQAICSESLVLQSISSGRFGATAISGISWLRFPHPAADGIEIVLFQQGETGALLCIRSPLGSNCLGAPACWI